MSKFLAVFLLVVAVLTLYAIFRERIREQPWARPFFDWVEPIEATLWLNSKTILFARLKMATGVVLTVLITMSDANLSVALAPVIPMLREQHQAWINAAINMLPLSLTVMGAIDEYLRKITRDPIELATVTRREIAENPTVARALESHDAITASAVTQVEIARS
jgi:hypothetical protein